jgi:uncharacterized membrane protein YhaH (DUF805 family)
MLQLLFGFHGRINRAQYWLSCFVIGVLGFAGYGTIMLMAMQAGTAAAKSGAQLQSMLAASILIVPFSAALAWAGFATQVKRFHDRGRSGFLTLIPMAIIVVAAFSVIGALISGAPYQVVAKTLEPFIFAGWAVNLWFFIDLGCLPSVEGPNKYGNPPGSAPAPTPSRAPSAAPAATLGGAEAAMQRALASRDRAPQVVQPQSAPQPTRPAPSPSAGPSGAPSFGRRVAR